MKLTVEERATVVEIFIMERKSESEAQKRLAREFKINVSPKMILKLYYQFRNKNCLNKKHLKEKKEKKIATKKSKVTITFPTPIKKDQLVAVVKPTFDNNGENIEGVTHNQGEEVHYGREEARNGLEGLTYEELVQTRNLIERAENEFREVFNQFEARHHVVEATHRVVEEAHHVVEATHRVVEEAHHVVEEAPHVVEEAYHVVEEAHHVVEEAHHERVAARNEAEEARSVVEEALRETNLRTNILILRAFNANANAMMENNKHSGRLFCNVKTIGLILQLQCENGTTRLQQQLPGHFNEDWLDI